MTDPERKPLSDVFSAAMHNVQEILRNEIRLARTEVKEEATKVARASVLLVAGAVVAFYAGALLLIGGAFALGQVVPLWASFLIVAGALGIIAAGLVGAGRSKLKNFNPTPQRSIEQAKETMEWVKNRNASNVTSKTPEAVSAKISAKSSSA